MRLGRQLREILRGWLVHVLHGLCFGDLNDLRRFQTAFVFVLGGLLGLTIALRFALFSLGAAAACAAGAGVVTLVIDVAQGHLLVESFRTALQDGERSWLAEERGPSWPFAALNVCVDAPPGSSTAVAGFDAAGAGGSCPQHLVLAPAS